MGSVEAVPRPSIYYSSSYKNWVIVQGSIWAVSPHFRAVFGQYLDKKDRGDCPVGLCKLLIFRFLTLINPLVFFLVKEVLGPFLPTDNQLHITDYPVGAVSEQSLVYWTVPKRLFNYSKIVSKSTTPLLLGG